MHIEITGPQASHDREAAYTAVDWGVDAVETGTCQRCGRRVVFYGPLSVECPRCHAWRDGYLAGFPRANAVQEEAASGNAAFRTRRAESGIPAPRVPRRRSSPRGPARRLPRLACRTS